MTPTLRTERLVLRPLAREDGAAMYDALGDVEVMAFWDWPGAQSPAEAQTFVDALCDEAAAGHSFYWAITVGGAIVGTCDLSEIDEHHKRAEVGFMLMRQHWNKGYAREAMRAVVRHAFEALDLERLSARTHTGNAGSARLLTSLGFRHEGRLRGFVLRDGKRRDCELYGLVKG